MIAKVDRKWGERGQHCYDHILKMPVHEPLAASTMGKISILIKETACKELTQQTCFQLSNSAWDETQACQCNLFSSSRLQIAELDMLGVAAATNCRSDRENDRHGEFRRGGGGDELLLGGVLPCGCRGGRQKEGDVETEFESSLLLLLTELVMVTPIGIVLRLELVGLFDIPPPLFFKG